MVKMGRFEGINKMLKMALVKTIFLLVLLSILGSCQNTEKNSTDQSNPKEKKSDESYNLQKTDATFFEKIKLNEITAEELLKYFHKGKINTNEKLEYQSSEINMDEDEKLEMILRFYPTSNPKTTNYFYLIDFKKINKLTGSLSLQSDGLQEPKVDTVNQIIFVKSTLNGTCENGYRWVGFKLIDGEFLRVIDFYGTHEGSSCGTFTDEDDAKKDFEFYSTIESKYEFQDKNTLINTSKISYWKYDEYMDTYTEKIITDKEIKLYYIYNPNIKKFECFNSKKKKLLEDGMIGTAFELITLFKNEEL